MTSFRLDKWYLDVLTEDGTAYMGYSAELEWRVARLGYGHLLRQDAKKRSHTRTSLRASEVETGEVLAWRSPTLQATATLQRVDRGVKKELLRNADGAVVWDCMHPRSEALLEVEPDDDMPGPARITGIGYAERLTLTMAPWKLPIKRLRWGRFTGKTKGLVWLDWQGPHNVSVFIEDGLEVRGRVEDATTFTVGGSRVELTERRVLREGPLGTTALAALGGALDFVPLRFLGTVEHKWFAHGVAVDEDGMRHEGLVIDEIVEFP